MSRILLHIGMPRTASTLFQKEVFPHLEGFDYWGVDKTQYSTAFQKLLYRDDSLYNAFEIQEKLNFPITKNLMVSNELFVGQSLFLNSTNRSRNAHRLKQLFPNAEIVLFLRNQPDLLESLYSIGIYAGETKKPDTFIRFDDDQSDPGDPLYSTFAAMEQTEQYYFTSIYRLYRSKFERVHVFLYEDFKSDPEKFIEKFCKELRVKPKIEVNFGKRENSSLSSRQLEYLRKTNSLREIFESSGAGKRLFRKNIRTIEHFLGGKEKFHFSPALRKKIKDHFKKDNSKLSEIVPELENSECFEKYYLTD